MAEIEYAMLAQFASVAEDGSLTVVGGHRAVFEVAGVPGQHVLCVAGRVLLARREPPPTLSLGARTPDGDVPVVARWPLEVHDVPMEGGRRPAAFAATLVAPAPAQGEYALTLMINDDLVRTLPFTVVDSTVDAPTPAPTPEPPPAASEAPTPAASDQAGRGPLAPRVAPREDGDDLRPGGDEPGAGGATTLRRGRRAALNGTSAD